MLGRLTRHEATSNRYDAKRLRPALLDGSIDPTLSLISAFGFDPLLLINLEMEAICAVRVDLIFP
jgi:hypothetical protein